MNRLDRVGVAGRCALAAALIGAPPVLAQAPAAPTTMVVADPGHLNGVWISSRFTGAEVEPGSFGLRTKQTIEGKDPPLQPWAQAVVDKRLKDTREGHPTANLKSKCLPAGLPMSMSPPANLPIQILVTPGQITILFEEFSTYRIIHMSRRHAADPDPGYFGDSVGHWEGDTLVVDSVAIRDSTTIDDAGIPHSPDLHVVERYRRTGPAAMEIQTTLDDPKTFTAPWTIRSSFKQIPDMELAEYYCDNDRNPPDASGKTTVQMPGKGN